MRRLLLLLFLTGCAPSGPSVVQEAEFKERIVVDHAEPIDPQSVLFTLHADGRVSWKRQELTPVEMVARVPRGDEKVNRTPVLFEVEPAAGFHVVRDALEILTGRSGCVNYALLVTAAKGPGAVILPMQADLCMGIHYYEGRSEAKRIGGEGREKRLELLVSPAKDGALKVTALNFTVPGSVREIYFPAAGEKGTDLPPFPEPAWTGAHPPCGIWSKALLETFLSREDVSALSPYIQLKVTTRETAADVLRCLSTLRSIPGLAVIPEIPTRP